MATRLWSWRRNGTKDGVCRYLVLVPYRGLGNRILYAASAFLYERLGIQVRLAPFLPLTFEVMYEQITPGARGSMASCHK